MQSFGMAKTYSLTSAPRDGTPILLLLKEPLSSNSVAGYAPWNEIQTVIGWWDTFGWTICFMEEGAGDSEGYTSHFYQEIPADDIKLWMPLPWPE